MTRTGETETTTVTREERTAAGRVDVEKEIVIERLAMNEPILFGRHDREAHPLTELVIVSEPYHDKIKESLAGMVVYWKEPHPVALDWGQVETCPGCGQTVIWAMRGYRHYHTTGPYPCSERCRSRMRRPQVDLTRECEWCGERFTPARAHAVTCSTRCRVARHRARNASEPLAGDGPGSVTERES